MLDSTEDLEIVYVPKPMNIPDGGYGWVTVFAAFMNAALIDGLFYSFGIISVYLIEYLPPMTSQSFAINLIGAFQLSFPLLSGPIGSVLGQKFGFRPIAMGGGLLTSVCMIVCFFAPPNIFIFYIFYGIIGGVGLGMIFMAGIITISEYFEKKRPLSTGIAVCGTGFGIFFMGNLVSYLINQYSWHGTILVLSALMFQTILFSALLRPLNLFNNHDDSYYASQSASDLKPAIAPLSILNPNESAANLVKSGFISSFVDIKNLAPSNMDISTYRLPAQSISQLNMMYIRSITSITSIPMLPPVTMKIHASSLLPNSVISEQHLSSWSIVKRFYFRPIFFKSLPLFLYYLSALLFSFGFSIPFYYIPRRLVATFDWSNQSAVFILSVMGLSSLSCRLLTGVCSTLFPNSKLWVYVACLVLCGLPNLVSSEFNNGFTVWIFWAIFVGGGLGGIVTLESVILAELVNIQDMASAFGSYQLVCGISTLLGPPMAGFLFDSTGSYNLLFWLCGIIFVISGVVVIPIHWLSRKNTSAARDKQQKE